MINKKKKLIKKVDATTTGRRDSRSHELSSEPVRNE
jgi:hypothetical protein